MSWFVPNCTGGPIFVVEIRGAASIMCIRMVFCCSVWDLEFSFHFPVAFCNFDMCSPQDDILKCHIVLNPPKWGNISQFCAYESVLQHKFWDVRCTKVLNWGKSSWIEANWTAVGLAVVGFAVMRLEGLGLYMGFSVVGLSVVGLSVVGQNNFHK